MALDTWIQGNLIWPLQGNGNPKHWFEGSIAANICLGLVPQASIASDPPSQVTFDFGIQGNYASGPTIQGRCSGSFESFSAIFYLTDGDKESKFSFSLAFFCFVVLCNVLICHLYLANIIKHFGKRFSEETSMRAIVKNQQPRPSDSRWFWRIRKLI